MRILQALLLALALIVAPPALAQSDPVKLITGSAETCTGKTTASGTSVLVTCTAPAGVYVVPLGQPIRYSVDVYRWDGARYVPQFKLPGVATPVIMADPVQRVILEFGSGRRETIPK